jgi:hypothetical protein
MEEAPAENVIVVDYCSREWARLIRKLRWIGLEEEAHRLGAIICDCNILDNVPQLLGLTRAELDGARSC